MARTQIIRCRAPLTGQSWYPLRGTPCRRENRGGLALDVQLARAQDVKQAPGRPKSDKLDCVWQAKCTQRGLLRPSFVPSAEIRQLRDYTRLRVD